MSLESSSSILQELKEHVNAGNIVAGKQALDRMKIEMIGFPPMQSSPVHLAMSKLALELGVLLSVADHDLEAFARNMSQLRPYYTYTSTESDHKYHVLGLNLMYLLVENRLSEFHSELELLTPEEASSPYITFPINLERQLMVGLYDEVLGAVAHVPDPSYLLFMDSLLQTVRESIADCLEVSYQTMNLSQAVDMMKFEDTTQLLEYIKVFRDDWIVESNNMICFQSLSVGNKVTDIPSMKFIEQTLSYASELERII